MRAAWSHLAWGVCDDVRGKVLMAIVDTLLRCQDACENVTTFEGFHFSRPKLTP